MRSFEFARKLVENEDGTRVTLDIKAFPDAQLPEYQTKHAAGADFFCAKEVTIKPLWESVFSVFGNRLSNAVKCLAGKEVSDKEKDSIQSAFAPTKVHTGIKANMEDMEVLELYNRSSNPKNLGLVLANGVGVVDSDYYNSPSNDGEIMFAFYNVLPWSVTLKVGDRIGQGVFKKVLRPVDGLRVKDVERTGGFGSTNNTLKEGIKENTGEYSYVNCLVPVCSKGDECKGNAFFKGDVVMVCTKTGKEVHGIIRELQDSYTVIATEEVQGSETFTDYVIVPFKDIKSMSKVV